MANVELLDRDFAIFSAISGVVVTIGNATPTLGGQLINVNSPFLSHLGGVKGTYGASTDYVAISNLTLADGSRTGIGGRMAFDTTAGVFEVAVPGGGLKTGFGLIVDGQRVNIPTILPPDDGAKHFVKIDLAAAGIPAGWKTVEIEFAFSGGIGDVALPPGAEIRATAQIGPRLVFLGDSLTEGTGATNAVNDFPTLVGHLLGTLDIWQSGFGATGFAKENGNRPALVDRIQEDGVAAAGDIYVIQMGLNDSGDFSAAVRETLTALTQGVPGARIFVVGPFNLRHPLPNIIQASIDIIGSVTREFPGVVFLESSKLYYSKADALHPDDAGQQVVAEWIAANIQRELGIDGTIDQGVAGDVVGPLYFKRNPGETYAYEVLENGQVSSRFQIVSDGSSFPILKLGAGTAITSLDPVSVQVRITASASGTSTQTVSFDVRAAQNGTASSDTLVAAGNGVRVDGGSGNDFLYGSNGQDFLIGGAGSDWLVAAGNSDILLGGAGDDHHFISSMADTPSENANDGTDTLHTEIANTSLPDNFENLTLEAGAVAAAGNSVGNTMVGNAAVNFLFGLEGNDRLYGLDGDDFINGGSGDDVIDGGRGTDEMAGGTGNDDYYVDSLTDIVLEDAGEGTDRVFSSVQGYVKPANVEELIFVGPASNAAPVFANATAAVVKPADSAAGFVIKAADSDGDNLIYTASGASKGTVSGGAGGLFFYAAGAGFQGSDSFVVTATDSKGGQATQAVTITGKLAVPVLTPDWVLVSQDAYRVEIGGTGTVFGTAGFQRVDVVNLPGTIVFDGSFNRGGDLVDLAGKASDWQVQLQGSAAMLSDGDTFVFMPIGTAVTNLLFDDGLRSLRFDTASGSVKLGSQSITATLATIASPSDSGVPFGTLNGDAGGTVIFTKSASVTVGGRVEVFGTLDNQTVDFLSGILKLDSSFNRGGDRLELVGNATSFKASQTGSAVLLDSLTGDATVPVGTKGMTLGFDDGDRSLIFNTTLGQLQIGSQTISTTPTSLVTIG